MKDIFELVKAIKNTQIDNKTYVYFQQDTGEIKKIGGKSAKDNLSSIEVDVVSVESILHGNESLSDFKVDYDSNLQRFVVKKIDRNNDNSIILSNLIEVTNNKSHDLDVLIVQNIKKGLWSFKLSQKVCEYFEKQSISFKSRLFFSVTKHKDPNILYRTISIPLGNFISQKKGVEVEFVSDFEHIKNGVSIYTQKYFKNYQHKVVNR